MVGTDAEQMNDTGKTRSYSAKESYVVFFRMHFFHHCFIV
jgi:hypothetical protein